jgi:hypothetical protein
MPVATTNCVFLPTLQPEEDFLVCGGGVGPANLLTALNRAAVPCQEQQEEQEAGYQPGRFGGSLLLGRVTTPILFTRFETYPSSHQMLGVSTT